MQRRLADDEELHGDRFSDLPQLGRELMGKVGKKRNFPGKSAAESLAALGSCGPGNGKHDAGPRGDRLTGRTRINYFLDPPEAVADGYAAAEASETEKGATAAQV